MALFGLFGSKEERQSNSFSGPGEWWQWPSLFGRVGLPTRAGQPVSAESSLRSSAVFGCNRVISETIASLPVGVFQKTDDGREPAPDHALNIILKERANKFQTSYEFQELVASNVNLQGNSPCFVERLNNGTISQVLPLLPVDSVTINIQDNEVFYIWKPNNANEQVFKAYEIWHPKYLARDMFWGLSPVSAARESVGLDLASQEYGSKFFGNDATPRVVLSVPGTMRDESRKNLKESWLESHGAGNQRGVAVLEQGMKVDTIGLSNEDSQFLETRRFQVEEIARIFRVPTVLLQSQDKASTYASAEQFFQSFVTYTIVPWVTRLENSMNLSFLSDKDRKAGFFIRFSVEGLLRADAKTRAEFYASGIQNTWMNPNEARKFENMNPREGGDGYENPNISPGPTGQGEEVDNEE